LAAMNMLMLQAELNQARKQVQAAVVSRDTFARLTTILARYVTGAQAPVLVDGHPAIRLSDLVSTHKNYDLSTGQVEVGGTEGAPGEDAVVVVVREKAPDREQPSILAPSGPRLVLPGSA
jgi:hypothetical protein